MSTMHFFPRFLNHQNKKFWDNLENYSWKTFKSLLSSSFWTVPLLINIFIFEKAVSCCKYWLSIKSVMDSYWNPDPGYHMEHWSGLHKGCVCSRGGRHNCPYWDLWRGTVSPMSSLITETITIVVSIKIPIKHILLLSIQL